MNIHTHIYREERIPHPVITDPAPSNHIFMNIHTHLHTVRVCAYIHTYTHTHTHIYIYIHTYIYLYMHTHTYIHTFGNFCARAGVIVGTRRAYVLRRGFDQHKVRADCQITHACARSRIHVLDHAYIHRKVSKIMPACTVKRACTSFCL